MRLMWPPMKMSLTPCFRPCHFNGDVPWCRPPWLQFVWDSSELPGFVRLLPLPDYGSFWLLFLQIGSLSLTFFSFWYSYDADVVTLHVVQNVQ